MGKKQGVPETISDARLAKLKRKAGLPVEEPVTETPKKRRRTKEPKENGAKANGVKNPKAGKVGKKKTAEKKAPLPVTDDLPDDEFGGLSDGLDDEMAGQELGDDFLGSDAESYSVYDSEEEHEREHVFSEDEGESDAEERLTAANIEGLSRKLDAQLAQDEVDAKADIQESALQTNIAGENILSDDEDPVAVKSKALLAPDLQVLRTRITDNIRVLESFSKLCEEGRSRTEYTSQLLKDICDYYGYSEFLAEKLFNLFSPREAFEFFEANEKPRPMVIRTNTLRTQRRDLAQTLINRGVTLEPVGKWSKIGLQIFNSNVPIGATPEYLAGHYILQAASSFLPVMALSPQENERVLDMSAAPGGKTTHMAAMMKNTGFIVANDASKDRSKALVANVQRMGAKNVMVCNYDAREFPKALGLKFDRVLLDAPCTGTGVISKDPNAKTNKTERDFMLLPHMQKQLILAAIDSVKFDATGDSGFVVYSTCSVTVEENEQVVQYALSRRPNVRLVETGLPFGKEGFTSFRGKKFDPNMSLTRRYYPHTYNVDGFFVAKLQKIGSESLIKGGEKADKETAEVAEAAEESHEKLENGTAKHDDFGGFDEEEDKKYLEKARRNSMRRRGFNPKSDKKKANGKGASRS